jgi:NADH-quinone oxidoreductase subunit M
MSRLGGLLRKLPFVGAALVMAMMAGCGLPGFANFAGEVTVFFGAWKVFKTVTVLACWGALIIGAVYMLRAVRAVLHGPLRATTEASARMTDANPWRQLPFAVLLIGLLVFGFFPRLLSDKITPAADRIVEMATAQSGKGLEPSVVAAAVPAIAPAIGTSMAQEASLLSPGAATTH